MTMKLSLFLSLACVSTILLWNCSCDATPFPFNMSAEGSGESDPEVIEPASFTTRSPDHVSPTPRVTTATRIKHFILNQVVDFLRENLLLIIVISSLVIILIFIVCCASVMSHKRKLNAYYPSSFPTKKYVDHKDKSGGARTFNEVPGKLPSTQQARPLEPVKQPQTDNRMITKNLRTPSNALVGEKEGKESKLKPHEIQTNKEDRRPEETTQVAKQEEPKQTPSTSQPPLVCLCHLRNGNQPNASQNSSGPEDRVAKRDGNVAKVQGVVVEVV
ncbi:transmembrane protein 119 [Paramormyrops kingsleyae]|uniref:transmembrane protein 119 n=1 Tax=Paramormyrops kingsleyae TaxID=1676925 RepID=UPI003B96F72F